MSTCHRTDIGCVLAYGPQKAAIINDIVNGPEMHYALPAQLIIRNEASNVVLLTAELASVAD